jgi:hypothetical protein
VLFDLQSPRRRRVVQIVFGALAVVFAISFVFLGVGSGGGGGLGDILGGGGGGGDASSAFDDDIKAAEQQLQANPNNVAALAKLVQLHYSAGNASVDENGQLTADGQQELELAADAWTKYVKLSNGNVAQGPALYALQTFDRLGSTSFEEARTSTAVTDALDSVNSAVADWKEAAAAQQILIDRQPNAVPQQASSSYTRLASYLYLSGQTQAADQAVAKAKSTAQGGGAASIDTQLKSVKQLGTQLQTAIAQLTKQQKKSQQATGGQNPLGGLGGGGVSPGGLGSGGLSTP